MGEEKQPQGAKPLGYATCRCDTIIMRWSDVINVWHRLHLSDRKIYITFMRKYGMGA